MNKKEVLKIVALIAVPGTIPVWLAYKIYERLKQDGHSLVHDEVSLEDEHKDE